MPGSLPPAGPFFFQLLPQPDVFLRHDGPYELVERDDCDGSRGPADECSSLWWLAEFMLEEFLGLESRKCRHLVRKIV